MELDRLSQADNIMIVGYACTGKSTIANHISQRTNHEIVHTDDYIDRWSRLIETLIGRKKVIIEGTDSFRLLRFGYEPDIIIHMEAAFDWRLLERGKDYTSQDKGLFKVWSDYLANSFRGNIPIVHVDFLQFLTDNKEAKLH